MKTARSSSEENIKTLGAGIDRIAKQQFTISSNCFQRDLLLSGDVLIKDPIGNCVNKVADQLLMARQQFVNIHLGIGFLAF